MTRQAAVSAWALDPLPRIIRKIPKACFERRENLAWGYLARDLVLWIGLSALILGVKTWLAAPLAWPLGVALGGLIGCVLTGLFVVGHDAGHRSFARSERLNNFVGHVAMAPLLWPFHVWRLSHDHHHRWTHHAEHEIAWRPLTAAEYETLPAWKQRAYHLTRSRLFFLASMLFQFFYVLDAVQGRFFDRRDAKALRFSLRLTAVVGLAFAGATFWVGGLYGFVCLFLVPQLLFHFWLSTFTLFHHTSVDNQLLADAEWSPERAQLTMSVQVFYPRVVDWLTHDIAWHVPHHVCVGIPHYSLREAHRALKTAYPDLVQERRLTWSLVKSVIHGCHVIDSRELGGQTWRTTRTAAAAASVSSASRT